MADYPNSIPSLPSNKGDKTGSKTGTPTGGPAGDHASHHNQLARELRAALVEMGTNPSGSYATVKARLDDIVGGGGGGGAEGDGPVELNVLDFGAVCDCRKTSGASITSASDQLTCVNAGFTSADVGKYVLVQRAGSAAVPAPTGLTATPVSDSNSVFSAGNYYFRVDAGVCEPSLACAEIGPIAVGSGESVDLEWDPVTDLHLRNGHYTVYRSSTAGAWTGSKWVGTVRAIGYDGLPLTTLRDTGRALYASAPATTDALSPDDLVAQIVSVAGGVATLDRTATATVSSATIWWFTDNSEAFMDGAAYALESMGRNDLIVPGPPARYEGTYPNGIFEELAYGFAKAAWMPNYSGLTIRGIGHPRLRNAARDTEVLGLGAVIGTSVKDLTISSVNRWAGSDAGLVVDQAEYRRIATLADPITSTSAGIVATFNEEIPDRLFLTPNQESAGFLSWNYDPMASPTVEAIAEGVWFKRDPSDPTNKHKILLTFRAKHGTTAKTHLAGANFVLRPGQFDSNDVDIDINVENEVYQPSVGSMCRLNRIIFSRAKVTGNGVGGGWPACGPHEIFKGGTNQAYVVLGNNTRLYKYGQGNAYVNVIELYGFFRRGSNHVLIESPDCESLFMDVGLEQATFTHPAGILGGPSHLLYNPEIVPRWCGDAGASGGGWLYNLISQRTGTIRQGLIWSPGGGDNNSGYPIYLKGGWTIENTEIERGDPTYAAYFYTPLVDSLGLNIGKGVSFNGAAPLSGPAPIATQLLTVDAGVTGLAAAGIREQSSWGPVAVRGQPIVIYTANHEIAGPDIGALVLMNAGSGLTFTVTQWSGWPEGTGSDIVQQGAGQVTVAPGSGVTLIAPNGAKTAAQGSRITVQRLSLTEWLVFGDTTT